MSIGPVSLESPGTAPGPFEHKKIMVSMRWDFSLTLFAAFNSLSDYVSS